MYTFEITYQATSLISTHRSNVMIYSFFEPSPYVAAVDQIKRQLNLHGPLDLKQTSRLGQNLRPHLSLFIRCSSPRTCSCSVRSSAILLLCCFAILLLLVPLLFLSPASLYSSQYPHSFESPTRKGNSNHTSGPDQDLSAPRG